MTMAVYFDESGTHKDSPVTVFAGVGSRPERWIQFSKEWAAALDEFGLLPTPGYFHMADFEAHKGPYESWTEQEGMERLNRLLQIIQDHVGFTIGYALPTGIANHFVGTSEHSAYYFVGLWSVQRTAGLMNMFRQSIPSIDVRDFDYVFESMQKGHGHLLSAMRDLEEDVKWRDDFHIASFNYADKRDLYPLQAADILAYELYKDWPKVDKSPDQWRNTTKRTARYPIKALVYLVHEWYHIVSRTVLEDGSGQLQAQEWDAHNIPRLT